MEKGVFSAFWRIVLTWSDATYRFLSRVCYEDVMSVPLNSHVQIQNIRKRQFPPLSGLGSSPAFSGRNSGSLIPPLRAAAVFQAWPPWFPLHHGGS